MNKHGPVQNREWMVKYMESDIPPGTPVIVWPLDFKPFETRTTCPVQLFSGYRIGMVKKYSAWIDLYHCLPLKESKGNLMIEKEFLNISRKDRVPYTIKHRYMRITIRLSGSMIHRNQFALSLQACLTEILNADYSHDVEVKVEEFT